MISPSSTTTNGLTDAQLRASDVPVADATAQATLATLAREGAAITGASMPSGGSYTLGWLSAIWKALTDRLPSALVSGRLDVNVGNTPTVSAPVGSPVFVRLSDGSSAIATLPVSFPSGVAAAGVDAHDAVVTGNPILIGGYASTAAPTAVNADGDAVRAWFDRNGRTIIGDGGGSITVDGSVSVSGTVTITDGSSSITVDAPVGTPLFTRLSDGAGALDTRVGNIDAQAVGVNSFLSTLSLAHGYNGSSWDRIRTVNTGQVKSTLYDTSGAVQFPSAAALADGAGNPTTPIVGAAELLWNGTTWDRRPGPIESSLLSLLSRNTTTGTSNQVNRGHRGLQIVLRVSLASGTGGLSVLIYGIDPVSGLPYQLNAAPTAITTTGIFCYEVYPGSTGAGVAVPQRTSGRLPRGFTVTVSHGDGSSYTYSLGQVLLP